MTSSELAPLLNLNNRLKAIASEDELVDSQSEALDKVRAQLRDEPLVALVGPEDVGKTFIAWILCNEFDYTYNTWPIESLSGLGAIVDDAPAERVKARAVRAQCRFSGVNNCVYITDRRMREAKTIPTVTLRLTNKEEKSIIHRWENISDQPIELTSTTVASARKELNQYNL